MSEAKMDQGPESTPTVYPIREVQDALNGIFGADNAPKVVYAHDSEGDLYFVLNFGTGVEIPYARAKAVSGAGQIESFVKSNVKEALESLVKLMDVTIKELE